MEQTFTVNNALTTELTFDTALRQTGDVDLDGFTVEIIDVSTGLAISSETYYPQDGVYDSESLTVTFPSAGDYTVRFTEISDGDSNGAIVDNISLLVCFAGQTRIETADGFTKATDIAIGDLVMTENGPQAVRWVGRRSVTSDDIKANEKYSPVKITAGALGNGLPTQDLWVSRQHRILVESKLAKRKFGADQTLVAAIKLTELPGIYVDHDVAAVEYIHILFDEHEVVFAEGTPSESLLLGEQALKSLSEEARDEIALIFPETVDGAGHMTPAAPILSGREQRKVAQHLERKNVAPLAAYARSAA